MVDVDGELSIPHVSPIPPNIARKSVGASVSDGIRLIRGR